MEDFIRKYIVISGTILLGLLCLGICWLFKFQWIIVLIFAYIIGIANGMLILGTTNY